MQNATSQKSKKLSENRKRKRLASDIKKTSVLIMNTCPSSRQLILAIIFCLSVLPTSAAAQVAISTTVEEIYDDNIFLEDDEGIPPLDMLTDEQANEIRRRITRDNDGNPDEDFITHAVLGLSGALPIGMYLDTSAEAKVGTFIFSKESDESRLTLNTVLDVNVTDQIIPQPFGVSLRSEIHSGVFRYRSSCGNCCKTGANTHSFD